MKKLILLVILILTLGLLPSLLYQPLSLSTADFITQEIGFIFETRRILHAGFPLWSWENFCGAPSIVSYGFYTLGSPFVWLQCLFPFDWMFASFWVVLYLKLICMAAATRLYLREMNISSDIASAGAIAYTFSSYCLANLFYWHFAEPMIMMPLLLWALERVLRGQRQGYMWLIIMAFGTMFINYYFATGSFIGALIYLLFRMPRRRTSWRLAARCTGCVFIGIGIASPIWLPAFFHLIDGTRNQFYFVFGPRYMADFFGRHLNAFFIPQLQEGAVSELNYSMFTSIEMWIVPLFTVSAFAYMLRYRRSPLTWMLCVLVFLFLIWPANGLFTLYHDLRYTRWGYFLMLMIILAGCRFMQHRGKIPLKWGPGYVIITIGCFILAYLLLKVFPIGSSLILYFQLDQFMIYVIALTAGIALTLWLRMNCSLKWVLPLTVVVSLLYAGCVAFRMLHSKEIGWYYSSGIFDDKRHYHLSDNMRDMHWRVYNYCGFPNYGLVTGQHTNGGFSSLGPKAIEPFFTMINHITETPYPGITGSFHIHTYPILISCREAVFDYKDSAKVPLQWELIRREDKVWRYRLPRPLPMGFTYDSYITDSQLDEVIKKVRHPDLTGIMLEQLVLDSTAAPVARLLRHDHPDTARWKAFHPLFEMKIDSVYEQRLRHTALDFTGTSRGWCAHTCLDSLRPMFFSVSNEPGFSYFIDGKPVQAYSANRGFTVLIVPAGKHFIEAKFMPPGLKLSAWISGVSLLLLIIIGLYRRK